MKIISRIYEAEPWTKSIIGYQYYPQYRYYGIWLSINKNIILRITRKLNTEYRSRAISITLFNKIILDYQPDTKSVVKQYLKRLSQSSKDALQRLAKK